jgi:hypothetical protein
MVLYADGFKLIVGTFGSEIFELEFSDKIV